MRPVAARSRLAQIRLPIRTARLILRPPRRADVSALVPLVADWRVARATTIPHPYRRSDGEEFVRNQHRQRRRGSAMALLIFDRRTHRLLGGTGFHAIDWRDRRFELGYWVARSEWGKGIATEAAYAVCLEGFRTLQMHRVHAAVVAFNSKSAHVLRKLGFRLEGRERGQHRDGRRWVDMLRFGLLAGELRRPRATRR